MDRWPGSIYFVICSKPTQNLLFWFPPPSETQTQGNQAEKIPSEPEGKEKKHMGTESS